MNKMNGVFEWSPMGESRRMLKFRGKTEVLGFKGRAIKLVQNCLEVASKKNVIPYCWESQLLWNENNNDSELILRLSKPETSYLNSCLSLEWILHIKNILALTQLVVARKRFQQSSPTRTFLSWAPCGKVVGGRSLYLVSLQKRSAQFDAKQLHSALPPKRRLDWKEKKLKSAIFKETIEQRPSGSML